MKNLLHPQVAAEIVARVQHLHPNRPGRWGKMDAAEMLRHCNEANRSILENTLPNRPTTSKQRLIRFLCFHVLRKFPKNVQVNTGIHKPLPPAHFETEKEKFIQTIRLFAAHKQPIALSHPAFGRLNTQQWGISTWMHMDHHLRQFGV